MTAKDCAAAEVEIHDYSSYVGSSAFYDKNVSSHRLYKLKFLQYAQEGQSTRNCWSRDLLL